MTLTLRVGHSTVLAVPSLHYHTSFATWTRASFQGEGQRPGAVAVELGPMATREIGRWIAEISDRGDAGSSWPRMLGLIRRNRLVSPRYSLAALRLQEEYGERFSAVPANRLRRDLRFSAISLICLSATDSIIEALRSAVEYDIPYFGVDLEEFVSVPRRPMDIENPIAALDDLKGYVERNADACATAREEWVDTPRELMMASRVKDLASRYERVLLVCGLAHWKPLVCLLGNPETPTTTGPIAGVGSPETRYSRVVVAPEIARFQIDRLTMPLQSYERWRQGPTTDDLPGEANNAVLLQVHSAYRQAMLQVDDGTRGTAASRLESYFHYLANVALLKRCAIVDVATAMQAASQFVSEDFARRMWRIIEEGAVTDEERVMAPWLGPSDEPRYPYLEELAFGEDELSVAQECDKAQLRRGEEVEGPYFVDAIGGVDANGRQRHAKVLPVDLSEDVASRRPVSWIWPPCEYLFYGTAYRIFEKLATGRGALRSEPFNGQLLGGVDYRATIRARARGKSDLYVKAPSREIAPIDDAASMEPFVMIFDPKAPPSAEWSLNYIAGLSETLFSGAHSRSRFREVTEANGKIFANSVHYQEKLEVTDPRFSHCPEVESMLVPWGIVSFGNPCVTSGQGARWLESRDFACCPLVRNEGISDVISFYAREHQIDLEPNLWAESLIRMAMPFARRRVLVVAPDMSVMSRRCVQEAARFGVKVSFYPLGMLSSERVRELRQQYLVQARDDNATSWSRSVLETLGPRNRYLDMVPPWMRPPAPRDD